MTGSAIVQVGHWPPGKRRKLPSHRNAGLEIVYIARGHLTWQVEGRIEHVPPESVFFTLPWETHGGVTEREPGCELFYTVLRLNRRYARPSATFALHPVLGLSPAPMRMMRRTLLSAGRRCWPATRRLGDVLAALVAETSRGHPSLDAAHAWARLAAIELVRSIEGEAAAPPRPPAEQRVRQFLAMLGERCHCTWTLGKMADACDLGRTRFAEMVKRLTGDNPKMALNRARIGRAQHLLTTTDLPITHIALDCGLGSSQHFAAVFRDYVGCTAREYRRRHATIKP